MQDFVLLNNGTRMPRIGLGTWQSPDAEVKTAVKAAVEAGYRHVDTAYCYQNEGAVGQALEELLAEGKVRREELFITTKLWNTCHRPEHVLEACLRSLHELKLQYLDLYLVHYPIAWKFLPYPKTGFEPDSHPEIDRVSFQETWRAMEDLVDRGLVKAIGVSNVSGSLLHDIISYARIRPAVNQIELHPYCPQVELIRYCLQEGVQVTAYSPLGSSNRPAGEPKLLDDAKVRAIAEKHHQSPAAVLLRWAYQREEGRLVIIPKSVHPQRIRENLTVRTWALDEEDMRQLAVMPPFRYIQADKVFGVPIFH